MGGSHGRKERGDLLIFLLASFATYNSLLFFVYLNSIQKNKIKKYLNFKMKKFDSNKCRNLFLRLKHTFKKLKI
jgi:hypothetical protein